jgi:hypothetical protein
LTATAATPGTVDGDEGRVAALERENGELRALIIDLRRRLAVMVNVGMGGLN